MSSGKRRRSSRDLRGVSFPDRVDPGARRGGSGTPAAPASARSWSRCGDGFTGGSPLLKTPGRKLSAVRKLVHFHSAGGSEDPVQIAWSDSDQSDGETSRAPPTCRQDQDDLPDIDTDSDRDVDGDGDGDGSEDGGLQISDCELEDAEPGQCPPPSSEDVEISGFASDSEDFGGSPASGRASSPPPPPPPPGAAEGSRRRPLSRWLRSAQAMLQTPQKPPERPARTPEDSGRKRRKFSSGGLAERLNRLQSRQSSAVSFWKHQSDPSAAVTPSGERPGVLLLDVLEVHQECGLQVARCERRGPRPPGDTGPVPDPDPDPVLVLFSRETAAQLRPAPADQIHVHPPWQSLSVDGLHCPVILNTHFSQKVRSSPAAAAAAAHCPAPSRPAYRLSATFTRPQGDGQQASDAPCGLPSVACGRRCASLLEAIEGLGQAGWVEQEVEVVVQRVYCCPASCCPASTLGSRTRGRSPAAPPEDGGGARLCVLVQDHDGTFSVVQLHLLPSGDLLHHYCLLWQGRNCRLRGIKVVQRLTRDRSSRLFSLIDSLWPPPGPLPHPGAPPTAPTGPTVSPTDSRPAGPAPSFCYLLSGQSGSVRPDDAQAPAPLYVPPAERSLRDVLQGDLKTCCSFRASVLYTRFQSSDGGRPDIWCVLTDGGLQEDGLQDDGPAPPRRRTLPLCIKPSCVLPSSVLTALRSPGASCCMFFRDVLREHGVLLCVEQSVVQPVPSESAASSLPRPVRLDPLSPEVAPCSLCRLSGVIVGIDQDSAFSWPTCCHCGSSSLEASSNTTQSFQCASCCSAVDQPTLRVQMEVFLRCPSLGEATVKLKLQQETILSLLKVATASSSELAALQAQSLLGEQVGPVPAFVRVLTRTPSLWIGLDEVRL